jgi:hypothetical protein
MATRNTRLVLKNNKDAAAPFSGATLLAGEPIVNTAAGIMMFSGVTSGSNAWTPAGDGLAGSGGNNNFFEVGSNLYNLKIRNKITSYSGVTALDGLFLSGTSNGFVLAPISSIAGIDSYVTNFSYNDSNVLNLTQNGAGSSYNVLIDKMSGLTVSNTLSATTSNVGTENVTTLNASGATITTLNSTTINVNTLNVTGGSITNVASNPNDIVNYSSLTSYTKTNEVYVTGGTFGNASDNSNVVTMSLSYRGTPEVSGSLSGKDTFTTGGTYSSIDKSITFKRNDGTGYTVNLSGVVASDTYVTGGTITTSPSNNSITGATQLSYNNSVLGTYTLPFTDVFVTGFTYSNNTFTIKDNSGNTFSDTFNSVTGLSVTNLTDGRVVYVGTGGLLTNEAGFEYDASNNKLTVGNLNVTNTTSAATFGNGGVVIGSGGDFGNVGNGNLVVHGSLTVFGPSISAFTSDLYIEDNTITLNYNPTGSSASASLGSGWVIQDGSGGTDDVYFDIRGTGATLTQRGFATNLNDIFIRDTGTTSSPNGKRVLAEDDILDGGTY